MTKLTVNHLLTKSLESKDITHLRRINVALYNEIDIQYVTWIFEFISTYHKIPRLGKDGEFTIEFPDFIPAPIDAPLEYVFDKVAEKLGKQYIHKQLKEAKGTIDKPLIDNLSQTTEVISGHSIIFQDVDPSQYSVDQVRLKTRNPLLVDNLGTIMGSDFIPFFGRMKEQKTHITQFILLDLLTNYPGVLITNEITPLEYASKLDAIIAGYKEGFNTHVYRDHNGKLPDNVIEQLNRAATFRRDKLEKLKIISNITSVAEMHAAVAASEFRPAFVMIDGLHYWGSDDKTQGLRVVSNQIKLFCTANNIPVIAVSQSSRARVAQKKADTTSIGLTDAFAQDATIGFDCKLLKNDRMPSLKDHETIVEVSPIFNRVGKNTPYFVITDWNRTKARWKRGSNNDDEEIITEEESNDPSFKFDKPSDS